MISVLFALCLTVLNGPAPAAENWPEFRGPTGDGHSAATGLPVTWSETENVVWKTPIHGRAWSTPVVWGRQVWMTTATEDGREMFAVCVDRDTGKVLLDRKLFENARPEPLGNDVNSYGSPSPVIEEGRVYVHFGSYGTACLDTRTFKTVWERRDLPCRHFRGPGSSPILYRDHLILTMDGVDVQYMAALDKKSGKTVWKTDRSAEWNDLDSQGKPAAQGDFRKAYSTPLLISVNGKPQFVVAGAKAAYGYLADTGKEIWKVNYKGFSNASRALYGHGMAFVSTGAGPPAIWAIRPDGQGDVTSGNVVWKFNRMMPLKPSPLLVGELLYAVNDSGVVTCLEARTGQQVWQERIGGQFSGSPVFADGRIYFFSEQGKTAVLKPGRTFEKVAENTLADGFMASPAIAGKAFYLRTRTHLYRIEQKRR